MSILGTRVERVEDERMLTRGGDYVGDLLLPGVAHVAYVTSPIAHAHIESVELDDARSSPGVLGVFTHADLEVGNVPARVEKPPLERTALATHTVRYAGEPVVAVVATSEAAAADAAEVVIVDYQPLPAVVDPRTAVDAPTVIHDSLGSNLHSERRAKHELDFSACDVVIDETIVNQRVAACPIEGRVAVATWEDGRLVQWASSQGSHMVRDTLETFYGLDRGDVRVITPDVGGGFGAKGSPHPEELLLGALSRAIGRPVRWAENRSENMTGMSHGRGQVQRVRMGGTADGDITHYALDVIQDGGAHAGLGMLLPSLTTMMAPGVYRIDHLATSSQSVFTNTTPVGAYRGAGRPEAAAAIERAVDLFASAAGLDPAEVRRRNFLPPEAFPHATGTGITYDSGAYAAALDLALEAADYESLRAEQARRRDAGDTVLLGIGLAAYVEITAGGEHDEPVEIELVDGGRVLIRTGASPYGQGHDTTWAMLVKDRLGIDFDDIEIHHGDTDEIAAGHITGGSRSAQIVGSSVHDAAGRLLALARERAADLLEAAVDDVVFERTPGDGEAEVDAPRFHVAGTPARSLTWRDLAVPAIDEAAGTSALTGVAEFVQADATFPFGVHVAVVDLDTETGAVTLRRHIAVDDAGTILNPVTADGQVHGGLAQGAAQALLEAVEYDEDGNPLTTNFADYAVISAAELPMFERVVMETPTPLNELGAKGIGESATVGATPAVQNAVCDALAPLGVRHVDMPCTPMRVWEAIRAAGR